MNPNLARHEFKGLIFCVEFRKLSHLTRDLSQAEKKLTVANSFSVPGCFVCCCQPICNKSFDEIQAIQSTVDNHLHNALHYLTTESYSQTQLSRSYTFSNPILQIFTIYWIFLITRSIVQDVKLGLFGSTALSSLTIQQGITINFMLHFASARLRNNHMYMMVWLHCYFFS